MAGDVPNLTVVIESTSEQLVAITNEVIEQYCKDHLETGYVRLEQVPDIPPLYAHEFQGLLAEAIRCANMGLVNKKASLSVARSSGIVSLPLLDGRKRLAFKVLMIAAVSKWGILDACIPTCYYKDIVEQAAVEKEVTRAINHMRKVPWKSEDLTIMAFSRFLLNRWRQLTFSRPEVEPETVWIQ